MEARFRLFLLLLLRGGAGEVEGGGFISADELIWMRCRSAVHSADERVRHARAEPGQRVLLHGRRRKLLRPPGSLQHQRLQVRRPHGHLLASLPPRWSQPPWRCRRLESQSQPPRILHRLPAGIHSSLFISLFLSLFLFLSLSFTVDLSTCSFGFSPICLLLNRNCRLPWRLKRGCRSISWSAKWMILNKWPDCPRLFTRSSGSKA